MAKGARLAVRCADLASYSWDLDEESVAVGGCVRSMAWDPLGERLAVIFKGTCIPLCDGIGLGCSQYCTTWSWIKF